MDGAFGPVGLDTPYADCTTTTSHALAQEKPYLISHYLENTHTGGNLSDPLTAEWHTAQPYDFPP